MKSKKRLPSRGSLVTKQDDGNIATILMILALPEERDYFHGLITSRPKWHAPANPRVRYKTRNESNDGPVQVIVQTLHSMGNIEASLSASATITTYHPDLVLLVGLAGSLNPSDVQLGDVVISNQAKYYNSDKVKAMVQRPSVTPVYRFDDEPPNGSAEIIVDRRDALMTTSFLRYERRVVECVKTDALLLDVEDSINRELPVSKE